MILMHTCILAYYTYIRVIEKDRQYLQRIRQTDGQTEEPGNDLCEDLILSQQCLHI